MAQTVLAAKSPTWGNYLSGEWSVEELGFRIEHNIANRETWKILKDQVDDVKSGVLTTLHRYAITWTPEDVASELEDDADDSELEDGEFENLPLDTGKIIELYTAAEMDFEKGLKLVREVEKGSYLKPNTIPSFRPDALKALCEVVQIALEKLDPEPEEEDEEEDDSEDDEGVEDEDDEADAVLSVDEAEQNSRDAMDTTTQPKEEEHMTKEKILQMEADESAKEHKQHKDLIGQVYQTSEAQFKARLQLLVHQYRLKEKKALKRHPRSLPSIKLVIANTKSLKSPPLSRRRGREKRWTPMSFDFWKAGWQLDSLDVKPSCTTETAAGPFAVYHLQRLRQRKFYHCQEQLVAHSMGVISTEFVLRQVKLRGLLTINECAIAILACPWNFLLRNCFIDHIEDRGEWIICDLDGNAVLVSKPRLNVAQRFGTAQAPTVHRSAQKWKHSFSS